MSAIIPVVGAKDSEIFATPAQIFRRNRQMNSPIQNKAETQELKCGKSFESAKGAETNEGTSMPIRDPDTILSMIVLLLSCLALAALAHVFV